MIYYLIIHALLIIPAYLYYREYIREARCLYWTRYYRFEALLIAFLAAPLAITVTFVAFWISNSDNGAKW